MKWKPWSTAKRLGGNRRGIMCRFKCSEGKCPRRGYSIRSVALRKGPQMDNGVLVKTRDTMIQFKMSSNTKLFVPTLQRIMWDENAFFYFIKGGHL